MRYNFPPELMTWLLPTLSRAEDASGVNHKCRVAPRTVHAVFSSVQRADRCKHQLAETGKVPTIYVNRYWLAKHPYYIPTDDNHWSIVAREAGRHIIPAYIHNENWCRPELHRVDSGKAWLLRWSADQWRMAATGLTIEQVQVLKFVGVGEMIYGRDGQRSKILDFAAR